MIRTARARLSPTDHRILALALPALGGCKKQPQPPACDTTQCCELYKDEVYQRCTQEQDEVYGCGKESKHAYEACMDQLR